jgi:hypothetical protein
LSICVATDSNHPARPQTLTSTQRDAVSRRVTSDIRFLFKYSNFWLSFFHVPSFFTNYFDPVRREHVQPSLIYAMITLSTFMQSSELELGHAGRIRALRYRDEAESALQASVNAGWIDEALAQAAFVSKHVILSRAMFILPDTVARVIRDISASGPFPRSRYLGPRSAGLHHTRLAPDRS